MLTSSSLGMSRVGLNIVQRSRATLISNTNLTKKYHTSDDPKHSEPRKETFGRDKPQQSFNQHNTETSSSFKSHHRRTYERKRSDYEKEKEQSGGSGQPTIPFMTSTNHYERLNLNPSATASEIKSSYYSLSKEYHPDVAGKDDAYAAEQFRLITESYDVIGQPESRAEYDRSLNLVYRPEHVSEWRPKSNSQENDERFNAIHRMRQAEVLFRSKQELALEREKRLNPKKFRVGTFAPMDDHDVGERLQVAMRHVENLRVIPENASNRTSEFYRAHMKDVLDRRLEGLRARNSNPFGHSYNDQTRRSSSTEGSGPGKQSEASFWLVVLTLGALCALSTAYSVISGQDIASSLDTLLSKNKAQSSERKS